MSAYHGLLQDKQIGRTTEDEPVYIHDVKGPEPFVVAYNEAGYNSTAVSLILVLDWVRKNRPDLLPEVAVR